MSGWTRFGPSPWIPFAIIRFTASGARCRLRRPRQLRHAAAEAASLPSGRPRRERWKRWGQSGATMTRRLHGVHRHLHCSRTSLETGGRAIDELSFATLR